MDGSLLFVHGTGVRQPGLRKLVAVIEERCRANGLDGIELCDVPWGQMVGASLEGVAASLPDRVAPEATLADVSDSAGAWALLLDDPLFELRLAAEQPRGGPSTLVPGARRADEEARARLQRLGGIDDESAQRKVAKAGLTSQEVAAAALLVAASPELSSAALAADSAVDPDLVEAMARAVVASVLGNHRSDAPGLEPAAAFDRDLRAEAVQALTDTIAPEGTMGIGGWLKDRFVAFSSHVGTSLAGGRRGGLMDLSSPFVADILYYQRRGDEIRSFVASRLAGLRRPVVAVGHSLGGVVLVDLLSRGDAPPVDLLVTVGSQSPLFYTIDALEHLRPGQPSEPFRPWLNIYNPKDFLSFCAERVFPGFDGIVDQVVDPEAPFPESHGAYWFDDTFYRLLRQHWPLAT